MATGDLVRFGLSNVHYATKSSSGTWETPVPLKGAVQLTTTPEGDSNTFYADNRAYYVTETNNGYSGTIEVAATNDTFLTDVLGYEVDETSGLTYEATDAKPTVCALLFEVDGNEEQQRGALYGVTFSRVESENNTKSDSTEPDTVTLNFTAIGEQFEIGSATRNIVKVHCSNSGSETDAYDNFFTKVPQPGTAPVAA